MMNRLACTFAFLLAASAAHAQGFGGGTPPPAPAPAPPAGDAAGTSQIVDYPLAGKTAEFNVPAGWTSQKLDGGALVFTAPADKASGTLYVALFSVETKSATTLDEMCKSAAEVWKENSMSYGSWEKEPQDDTFLGMPAKYIVMRGNDPESKTDKVALIVVTQQGSTVIVGVVFGGSTDIQANAEDLATVVYQAKFVSPQSAGKGGHNGPRKSGGAPAPVNDVPWGLEIGGLNNDWRMETRGGAYVYAVTKEVPATITVRHAWADPSYGKKLKGKAAKVGSFDAIVVEGKDERVYHIVMGEHATQIAVASPRLSDAEARWLPVFAKGLKLSKVEAPKRRAKVGVTMTLANNVRLSLGKGWSYEDAIAAGGKYSVAGSGGKIVAVLRLGRRAADGTDPFSSALASVKVRCADMRGAFEEGDTTLSGKKARRVTCTPQKGSKRELRPFTALVTREGDVAAFVFLGTDGKALAEPRVNEFLGGITLP